MTRPQPFKNSAWLYLTSKSAEPSNSVCFLNRSPFKPTPKEHIPPPQATFRPPFDFNFPRGCGWSDPRSDPRAAERQLAAWQSLPCPASETEPREPQVRPLCTIQQWHHPPWYGFWRDGWTLLVSGNPMIQQWHHPPLGSKAFSAIGFGGMDGLYATNTSFKARTYPLSSGI